MTTLETLLSAIAANPSDELAWLALADALEESGEPRRAELTRLTRQLLSLGRTARKRRPTETRVQELLIVGVRPCVPEITNSIGMRLVLIPPGKFRIGSPAREMQRLEHEPLRDVVVERPFWMGVFPVTQGQFVALMKTNPSAHKGVDGEDTSDWPADNMSWAQARSFCNKLSRRPSEKKARRKYRLPTENKWEYACRAGTTTAFAFGPRLTHALANFGNELGCPCPVGRYPPNAWGLYDMHGNVWEKCVVCPVDVDEEDYIEGLRGAAYRDSEDGCRSAFRTHNGYVDTSDNDVGFRVVMEVE
jgi:uncharacterized protein (TIGR02996 family)